MFTLKGVSEHGDRNSSVSCGRAAASSLLLAVCALPGMGCSNSGTQPVRGQWELPSDAQAQSVLGVLLLGDSRKATCTAANLWPLGLGVVTLGQGPCSPPSCVAVAGCAFSRHELTVKEFMKPKPGPVENLFLISGQRGCRAPPSVLGVGAALCSQLGAPQPAWGRGGLSAGHWTRLLTCGVKGASST